LGEAQNVRWHDVDWEKHELVVRGDPVTGTKNWEIRRVPMIPELTQLLQRMRGQRPIQGAQAKPFVDRALVELIVLNASVGRMDVLKQLIPLADARGLTGSSREKIDDAKQALVLMQTMPGTSFRCGPIALEKIRNMQDNNDSSKYQVLSLQSTQKGTSMLQLKKLSYKLGLDYQVAKRTPGAAIEPAMAATIPSFFLSPSSRPLLGSGTEHPSPRECPVSGGGSPPYC
jgi:hypothetical protein